MLTSTQAVGKFIRPGDLVIGETGTSAYGLAASRLPKGASMYSQTVFGSIGFATGAAVGSFQAIKESGKFKRGILITGEGSLQLTVQAFADMLKLGLNPIIIILNNNGYTVERLIHGKNAPYNKVPDWDYSSLAKVFGPDIPSKYWGRVDTCEGLEHVFADAEFNDGKMMRVLELGLGYLDAPANVLALGPAIDEFNRKK